jgi:rhodanese-related sulfurtransferase
MCPCLLDSSSATGAARRLGADRVLVVCTDPVGDAAPRVGEGGVTVVTSSADPVDQQPGPFRVAFLGPCLAGAAPEVRRSSIHLAVQHLERGGMVAMGSTLEAAFADLCDDLELTRHDDASLGDIVAFRRSDRTTVHYLLWEARALIERIDADELAARLQQEHPPLVVDTRTHTDRTRMGVIPGSIHVPRTVLEWHLDPANGYRHPAVTSLDRSLVVVCNGGYSSSLAVANLVRIGFTDVCDLIGGMRSWVRLGHPVHEPDHAHLDL